MKKAIENEFKAAVYAPPFDGLPYLAVVLDPKGEVLAARSVQSPAAGQAFLDRALKQFLDKVAADRKRGH